MCAHLCLPPDEKCGKRCASTTGVVSASQTRKHPVPISIQAAPPPATPDKAPPSAKSAKGESNFAAILAEAQQAAPKAGKSAPHADNVSPENRGVSGKSGQGKDGKERNSGSECSDARLAIDLTALVPVTELSLPVPAATGATAGIALAGEAEPGHKVDSPSESNLASPQVAESRQCSVLLENDQLIPQVAESGHPTPEVARTLTARGSVKF